MIDAVMIDSVQTTAEVLAITPLSEDNYRLRLHCPKLAARILPGQFFMLRSLGGNDPLLGRPFALYDTVLDAAGQPIAIDVGFHVIGKMTQLMEQLQPGESLEIWGPLGNGFPVLQTDHLIQVAGGIGYTPFVAVSREALKHKTYGQPAREGISAQKATLIYGVRSKKYRADMSDLADITGLEIQVCTDDGSEGHRGLVTDLLKQQLDASESISRVVLTCGPLRMMQAVAEVCRERQVACWVSLETPMACGFGACFSCVVPVCVTPAHEGDSNWDYKRVCVEGPVFPAEKIVWTNV